VPDPEGVGVLQEHLLVSVADASGAGDYGAGDSGGESV